MAHLLTFWPPGPDDLLKETSPKLRGIVLILNSSSQCLASRWSSSENSSGSLDVVDLYLDRETLVRSLVLEEVHMILLMENPLLTTSSFENITGEEGYE